MYKVVKLCFTNFNIKFQLGVSCVEDISSVLGGAADNTMPQKLKEDDESEAGSSKKLQSENQIYRDSSLFLKVCFIEYLIESLQQLTK